MGVKQKLKDDLITAMKSGEKSTVSAIRLINSKIKNDEIEVKRELTDSEIYKIIKKEIKDANETLGYFRQRYDESKIKEFVHKIEIFSRYIPPQLTQDAIQIIVNILINKLNITSASQKKQLMRPLMQEIDGRADGKLINKVVDEELAKL